MNELVSIIMPSYNTAHYISDSINSVLSQTYSNWELIIVDDCSTDNSVEVIQSFEDSRIKLLQNEINSGAAISRNNALREAKGKWIAFLDSDDLWFPEKLEHQIYFMKNTNCHFSYTDYLEIDDGDNTFVYVSGPKRISRFGFYNYCWPGCLTVMYDADYVGVIQITDIKKNNDYSMWLKVSEKANCYLLKECLAMYRRSRSGSISSSSYINLVYWHYKLFKYSEGKNGILASLLTIRNIFFGLLKKLVYVKRIKPNEHYLR